MHDASTSLKVTPRQLTLIERAAELRRMTLPEFVLEAAHETAREVVRAHGYFDLEMDTSPEFTKPLDGPGAPSPGLERLVAVLALWVTNPDRPNDLS